MVFLSGFIVGYVVGVAVMLGFAFVVCMIERGATATKQEG